MSCCDPKPQEYLKKLNEKKMEYMKYESMEASTWCDGCGDFGIQKAIQRALVLENIEGHQVLACFDIGCHGNGSDKIGCYTLHGLHGRVIPVASGAALANHKIKVIAQGGDGGTLSEGINHLVHAVRNNYPMVFILHNNENYGLTIGQASATTRVGEKMLGAPDGVFVEPMNACRFVLNLNPSFVARCFSSNVKHMTEVMRKALNHNGFAFVEVMQLCPTFNKHTSENWFWDRVRYVEDLKGYDPANLETAMQASKDLDKEILLGVLYQNQKRPVCTDMLPGREGKTTPLVEEVRHYDIGTLLKTLE